MRLLGQPGDTSHTAATLGRSILLLYYSAKEESDEVFFMRGDGAVGDDMEDTPGRVLRRVGH